LTSVLIVDILILDRQTNTEKELSNEHDPQPSTRSSKERR
jgi:hypothetical protein